MVHFFWKIKGLAWANTLAIYSLWLMTVYLIDEWGVDYRNAAIIVNVYSGSSYIMTLALQHIIDAYTGNIRMVLFSNFIYFVGLGILTTVSSFDNCKGNGDDRKCHVKIAPKILFYTALPVLAFGSSIHELSSLEEIVDEQEDGQRLSRLSRCFKIVISIMVHLVGAFAIPRLNQWPLIFGTPGVCILVTLMIFYFCSPPNRNNQPQGSFLTSMFRVFVDNLLRRSNYPITNSSEPREVTNNPTVPHDQHRFVDRATNAEVEETKKATRRVAICMAFLVLGIVSAVGDTYFIAQADTMDRVIGKRKYEVPIVTLELCYQFSKYIFPYLYFKMAKKLFSLKSTLHVGFTGILTAMVFSVLCFATAATVEVHRLKVVKKHDLYGSDEPVPMSMLWLLPQYFLLGGLDGFAIESIFYFFSDRSSTSSDRIMGAFSLAIFGVGKILSIMAVYITGKLSAIGDGTSWFVEDLNSSRLDKYCWVLTSLTALNFFYSVWLYYHTTLRLEVREDNGIVEPEL